MVFNDNNILCISGVLGWDFNLITSNVFCYMCSPVEHYGCFYLIFFEIEDALSPVKTAIGFPGKVVCLRYASVYCACLSRDLARCLSFRLKLSRKITLLGKS